MSEGLDAILTLFCADMASFRDVTQVLAEHLQNSTVRISGFLEAWKKVPTQLIGMQMRMDILEQDLAAERAMREILTRRVKILEESQAATGGTGILFSSPSGPYIVNVPHDREP